MYLTALHLYYLSYLFVLQNVPNELLFATYLFGWGTAYSGDWVVSSRCDNDTIKLNCKVVLLSLISYQLSLRGAFCASSVMNLIGRLFANCKLISFVNETMRYHRLQDLVQIFRGCIHRMWQMFDKIKVTEKHICILPVILILILR